LSDDTDIVDRWAVGYAHHVDGFEIPCMIALIFRRHLSLTGWMILLSGIYAVKFIFERLRSAIKYGDPTEDLISNRSV